MKTYFYNLIHAEKKTIQNKKIQLFTNIFIYVEIKNIKYQLKTKSLTSVKIKQKKTYPNTISSTVQIQQNCQGIQPNLKQSNLSLTRNSLHKFTILTQCTCERMHNAFNASIRNNTNFQCAKNATQVKICFCYSSKIDRNKLKELRDAFQNTHENASIMRMQNRMRDVLGNYEIHNKNHHKPDFHYIDQKLSKKIAQSH
eukprot:TRINITY_DN3367_c0_g3_i6.p1 TRINITY_DN3367_c0_g3~~TRINITY_DN3367_c0_g3_i6.p1  ORF type:complete len:199 (-),score=0.63 TRINITY_DN3367_c0_g3_i6:243-839(-)